MSDLTDFFEERLQELDSYVKLLETLDSVTQSGTPRFHGADSNITVEQQRILYSSVYLQLYNLVEATVTRCVLSITAAAGDSGMQPLRLIEPLRREWVRAMARTHEVDMGVDKRLEAALAMFDHLVAGLEAGAFEVKVGGGGNWDDENIEKVSARLGCHLTITKPTKTAVKRHRLDELGALKLVKLRRNQLAHGGISFVSCSDNVVVGDLRALVHDVGAYLRETVACFEIFVSSHAFLTADTTTTVTTSA